jgi:protein-S-isoprenylcysteine O-methyltransferase Ste14
MSNVIARSILGLLFLVACLAAALFLSAGSLAFWQAWAYLAVWTLCTVLITAYLILYDQRLLASRVQAGPTAETQKVQQVIQSLAGLFFMSLFIVAGLDFRFHGSTVPPLLSWVSSGFVVLGFVIVFLVFRANTYTSAVIEVANDQRVITTGPYSVVRHPMYTGAAVLLLFTPPALGSWLAVPLPFPLIGVVIVRLLAEETFLRVSLAGYEEYCQKVRYRLVPFVW